MKLLSFSFNLYFFICTALLIFFISFIYYFKVNAREFADTYRITLTVVEEETMTLLSVASSMLCWRGTGLGRDVCLGESYQTSIWNDSVFKLNLFAVGLTRSADATEWIALKNSERSFLACPNLTKSFLTALKCKNRKQQWASKPMEWKDWMWLDWNQCLKFNWWEFLCMWVHVLETNVR